MSYSDAAKRARKRNGQSSFRAPRDLEPAGRARYYMKEKGIDEDELVMEGLLATDRVIAAASGRAPPGRNSRIDRNDYDTTDLVTDILTVGRAGQRVVDGAAEGDRHSDRKQRARTAIGNELNGYGEQAIRALCAQDGWVYAPVVRKNPRSAKRNPVSVAFVPYARGIDVVVNGRVVEKWATRGQLESRALATLETMGVPAADAHRLVRRALAQLREKEAAQAATDEAARWAAFDRAHRVGLHGARLNPVSVSIRRGRYGTDAHVDGKRVAHGATSFEEAEEAVFDALVKRGVPRDAASRLARRGTRQGAKRQGAKRNPVILTRMHSVPDLIEISYRAGLRGDVAPYIDGALHMLTAARLAEVNALAGEAWMSGHRAYLAGKAPPNVRVFDGPDVEFVRRRPALVLTDVPRSDLARFGDAVRKAYAEGYAYELPRLRIVVTTRGASPAQVASAIDRKWIAHQRSAP